MESEQPNVLAVVHIVVADMPNKAAYGATNPQGEPVVYADRAAIEGDPQARENAYKVISALAGSAIGAATRKFAPATF